MLRKNMWRLLGIGALLAIGCRSKSEPTGASSSAAPASRASVAAPAPSARAACAPPAALAQALQPMLPQCAELTLTDYSADEAPARCACVVAPSNEAEVAAVVRAARATRTPLRVRGSAHSANHSTLPRPGELLLSTARLDGVELDGPGAVTAGAGVPVVALSERLGDFGRMLPVVNDGWSGPTVGGYVCAGGMGARSKQYGGLWENVASVTLVDGTGTVQTLDRGHPDFPWLFGSMGQLGVMVSARLDVAPTSTPSPPYPSGTSFRLPPAKLLRVGSAPVSAGPDMKERLRWFTLLVAKSDVARARRDLARLQTGLEARLEFRTIYEYEFAFRRKNPPLFFGEDAPFVGIGVWAELRPKEDAKALADLERAFTTLVRDGGYRRYIQSEVTRGPDELRAYFGDELYEAFRAVKRRYDPDGIIDPGTVFPVPQRAGVPLPTAGGALWTAPVADTFTSSPRLGDLDGDDVDDVAIGAGVERRRGAVHAVSGETGRILWSRDLGAEAYPTPALVDVNADRVADVLTSGRMNDLRSYDGRTGAPLRSLRREHPSLPDAHLNTPVVVGDVDGDTVADVLVSQSGGNDDKRPPGWLHLISTRNLELLGSVKMPDGRETYAVPAVRRLGGHEVAVIVGTGGETVGGGLHRLDVTLAPGATSRTRWSSEPERGGFVASPLWVEVEPGQWVAIGASFDGVVVAHDGETGKLLWRAEHAGFIVYASPSVGRFERGEPCVVVVRSRGTSLGRIGDEARISWIRLRDGATVADERLGVFSTSTPLVADLDGDGFDEVIALTMLNVTSDTFSRLDDGFGDAKVELLRFEGKDRTRSSLATLPGVAGGTPTLQDADGDGHLDLLVAHGTGVSRFALKAPSTATVRVGRYRGFAGDGVISLRAAE